MIQDILRKVSDRPHSAHKYDFGHLLVVGGSKMYSGSPALSSLAAYRSGVDLVTTVAPKRAADIIASFSPSLITHPLGNDNFKRAHLEELEDLRVKADAVVIGGGMERNYEVREAIVKFLRELEIPAVVDADAIYAVAEKEEILEEDFILTPHAHEFKVLTGEKASKNQVRESARELGCVILRKGNPDVISHREEVVENETGNQYLTVGGTGDTLAGIAGSLLAQGIDPFKAAYGAAWINGKAGELAAEEKGIGTMPDDLLEKIPEVIG